MDRNRSSWPLLGTAWTLRKLASSRQRFFLFVLRRLEFHGTMTPFHLYLYGPMRGPIHTSFEEAESRLNQLLRLHFEPDGSFVWIRDAGKQQIYGMVYDAGGRIQYCELQGQCSYATWSLVREAIAGAASSDDLQVMLLPEQQLQDLQCFEQSCWPTDQRSPF